MVQVGFKTDRGNRRELNEDSLFVLPEQDVYIVADGVGGHNAGEFASRTAVTDIAAFIKKHPIGDIQDDKELKHYFLTCLREVNFRLFRLSKEDPAHAGMATTVVIAYLHGQKAYVVNVGDSRAYLIRSGAISQITEDHTVVNEMIKKGSITKEEALVHPMNNMITRALGGEEVIVPDFYQFETCAGDTILLCSDGLYGEVEDARIAGLAAAGTSMREFSARLIEEANGNGGRDNITAVCIRV